VFFTFAIEVIKLSPDYQRHKRLAIMTGKLPSSERRWVCGASTLL